MKIRKAYPLVPAKPAKYHATRVPGTFHGEEVWFDSLSEARRGAELEILEQAGEIFDLERQVPFTLLPAAPELGYKRPLVYKADFIWHTRPSTGRNALESYVICDVKGKKTDVYLIKKRILEQTIGLRITEVP